MKQYWLSLNQDTFLWTNEDKGCAYNTQNYRLVRFGNQNPVIRRATNELLQIDNLYRTIITEEEMNDPEVRNWINQLTDAHAARLVENNGTNPRPVSLMPKLKIQESLDIYKIRPEESGKIMMHLHELVIHINGSAYGNTGYAAQLIYPEKTSQALKTEEIIALIESMGMYAPSLNISLAGCPWEHKGSRQLLHHLLSLGCSVSFYVTYNDYLHYKDRFCLEQEYPQVPLHILISGLSESEEKQFMETAPKENIHYHFIVTSKAEFDRAARLAEKHPSGIKPVFTGNNLLFFEEFVYMTEEDLNTIRLPKRTVFAHQVINTSFFGTLTVSADGNVYAGNRQTAIGNIKDSLYKLVYKEMTQGNSWRHIRNQGPCADCIYRQLCPSPSGYELATGKPDLCHIR